MNHLKLQRYLAKGPAGKICGALGSSDRSHPKLDFIKIQLPGLNQLSFWLNHKLLWCFLSLSQGGTSVISSTAIDFTVHLIHSMHIHARLGLIWLVSPPLVKWKLNFYYFHVFLSQLIWKCHFVGPPAQSWLIASDFTPTFTYLIHTYSLNLCIARSHLCLCFPTASKCRLKPKTHNLP